MERLRSRTTPAVSSNAGRQTAQSDDVALSRRKLLGRTAGLAALGATGTVLSGALTTPASAQTVEQGALAPGVVALADAAQIAVDASLGNDFRVTLSQSRIIESPSNPIDGQKIIFQITQGSLGSSKVTWGSAYEFSTGLPAPTLSTTPGTTDLLAFIYNEAKGNWLFAAFMPGFAGSPVTTTSGVFRLFPSTSGPALPSSYSGPYIAGVIFEVTSGGMWLDGYWWWVCNSGQGISSQKFALWEVDGTAVGTLIVSATVTSGTLVGGQWNYVQLPAPVPLAIGATYIASTGMNNGFPVTSGQFGAGGPYASGIVSGPLVAYSDQSGSLPAPFGMPQAVFSLVGNDPTVDMPMYGYQSSNLWIDVQVATAAPAGTTFRLWPNYPALPGPGCSSTMLGYTLGMEFTVADACTVDKLWFYSGAGAGALPTRCGIWDLTTQTEIAGTDIAAPQWSGPAGSGWVSCRYSGVALPAGDYKAAVFYAGGSQWFKATPGYWAPGGPGSAGITAGPLSAPGSSNATAPGQSTYNAGQWAYPGTDGGGENYWIDIEVAPS